jgi:hypothetical protein
MSAKDSALIVTALTFLLEDLRGRARRATSDQTSADLLRDVARCVELRDRIIDTDSMWG